MSGESQYLPSSYYTLQTFWVRTKNGAPQFPAHIFKAKQSIDSYENVCKLFRTKTHTSRTVSKGIYLRSLKWKREIGEFISLCQVISWTFTLDMEPLTAGLKLCCQILRRRKQPAPKVKQLSILYILCFTKMKNLRRAVNPRPEWYPPDLVPPQNTHETCIVSMHQTDTLRSQTIQTPRQRAK